MKARELISRAFYFKQVQEPENNYLNKLLIYRTCNQQY